MVWAMLLRLSAQSAHTSNMDLGVKSCVGSQIMSEGDKEGIQILIPMQERGQGSHSVTFCSGELPIRGYF